MAEQQLTGFTGISFPFRFSPLGRVETSTTGSENIQHIIESVQQIVSTRAGNLKFTGERIIIRDFGGRVVDLIFSPINEDTLDIIKSLLQVALADWDNRIEVQEIEILEVNTDEAKVTVEMDLYVRRYQKVVTVEADLG